jgi:Uma2 family endonuclease
MARTKLVTVEDLEAMPEDSRLELIQGELVPMPPIGRSHGSFLFNLGSPLSQHVKQFGLGSVYGGEVGVVLSHDPDMVLAPDIAFVRGEPIPAVEQPEGYLRQLPDLVIEIASPSDSRPALRRKVALYHQAGIPNVWLVEYRSLTVSLFPLGGVEQVLTEADTLDGGEVVPGFRLPVAEIFWS